MEPFQVTLPGEFLALLNQLEGKSIDAKVKASLAIGLFVEKQVTLARAAALSGRSLGEFIDLLRDKNIAWMEYTDEDFKDDERAIEHLLGEDNG